MPTREVRILSLGKYIVAVNKAQPYFAGLDLKGDGTAILQPMSEPDFFKLLTGLLIPRECENGKIHCPCATVPCDG